MRYKKEQSFPEWMTWEEMAERFHSFCDASEDAFRSHTEKDLTGVLNRMQAEEDWRVLRSYLRTIESSEKIPYEQSETLLAFLIELLFDDNGFVRRLAAIDIGHILAPGIADHRMQCAEILRRILFLSGKKSEQKRRWIGSALGKILAILLIETKEPEKRIVLGTCANYFKSTGWDRITCLNLMEAIMDISWKDWTVMQRGSIFGYMRNFIGGTDEELAGGALLIIRNWLRDGWNCPGEYSAYLKNLPLSGSPAARFLITEIKNALGEEMMPEEFVSEELFQENLQSGYNWIKKYVNLDILHRQFMGTGSQEEADLSVYASHLLHVLRLNVQQEVFLKAGDELVSIIPCLREHQKNQIIQEILKAIELRDDSSNYLPTFLGRTFLHIGRKGRDELSSHMKELADRKTGGIVKIILETSCVILRSIPGFREKHPSMREELSREYQFFLGILCRGVASFRDDIARESVFLAGEHLFDPESDTEDIPAMMELARNLLVLKGDLLQDVDDFGMLTALSRISSYLKWVNESKVEEERKDIALYSGEFDPFTLEQRMVAEEISELGYHVYINVHDFSSKRRNLPLMLRRKMAALSTADLFDVSLLPAGFPVNPERGEDIERLAGYFPDGSVSVITDSDCVPDLPSDKKVQFIKLPGYYNTRSQRDIRKDIEEGNDFSDFIDPQVYNAVSEWNLYHEESALKDTSRIRDIRIYKEEKASGTVDPVTVGVWYISEGQKTEGEVWASLSWHTDSSRNLIIEALMCSGMETRKHRMLLFNELLLRKQEEGFLRAVCSGNRVDEELLSLFGFLKDSSGDYVVSLLSPLVVMMDAASKIKEYWLEEEKIKTAIQTAKNRVMQAFTRLYPGSAVFYFDPSFLTCEMERFLRKNQLLIKEDEDGGGTRTRDRLCVPFGKILKETSFSDLPVTPLHVEKQYKPDLSTFVIKELPDYPDLRTQIRSLSSFGRKLLLVDDIYHKGYRFRMLEGLFREEHLDPGRFAVGILSGRGIKLAEKNNRKVEALCTIWDMKAWFMESELYPFIGGDGLQAGEDPFHERPGIPSINTLLPWQMPSWLKDASTEAVYDLSMVCLENAQNIFRALEEVYLSRYHHILTLKRIGDVINEVRYPAEIQVEGSLDKRRISELIAGSIEQLKRLKYLTSQGRRDEQTRQ